MSVLASPPATAISRSSIRVFWLVARGERAPKVLSVTDKQTELPKQSRAG